MYFKKCLAPVKIKERKIKHFSDLSLFFPIPIIF